MNTNKSPLTKDYLDQTLDAKLKELKQSLEEKLDWLIGKYKSHDEEHTLMSGQLSEHSDRLEIIEQKVGISP